MKPGSPEAARAEERSRAREADAYWEGEPQIEAEPSDAPGSTDPLVREPRDWHNPDDLVAIRRLKDALSVLHHSILNPNMGRDDLIRTANEWYALAMRGVPSAGGR